MSTRTALELVRPVCHPKLMGPAVKSAAEASALPEQGGWEVFYQPLRVGVVPARLCTAAYLTALSIANGWRLERLALR